MLNGVEVGVDNSRNLYADVAVWEGMAQTPEGTKLTAKNRLKNHVDAGEVDPADADLITELCAAYDEADLTVPTPAGDSPRAARTIGGWCEQLTTMATRMDVPLCEADETDVNEFMQTLTTDGGLKKSSVRNYQNTARVFYRYHDDLAADPDEIARYKRDETPIDPEDMLTREEIDALRNACGNPRDSLIFHLLLYTGQRVTALRTLRLKDVRVDADDAATGKYRLNPEHGGLKRADQNGTWRPLLGAQGAVREWLQWHPDRENPDAYLITHRPSYTRGDATEPVSRELFRRLMEELKEEAGIDKPTHPHMMRHNFVTICKREHDMDNDTIRHLIGHGPDSKVMETTYAHLDDSDWIRDAEASIGAREEEAPARSLTPSTCNVCGHSIDADARACGRCGAVFTPDAMSVKDEIERDLREDYKQTDPADVEALDLADALDEALADPELRAMLVEKLASKGDD